MEVHNETQTDEYDYYYPKDYTEGYPYDSETEYICNLNLNRDMEIVIQTYVHSFICAFGLCGNALVIVTYAFYKKAKTMTDVYLLNVAVADLLFIVALPLIIYNEQHDWSMGSVVCKALRGAYSINLYSGMLLLACISGDRYISVVQARRSFGLRSRTLIYSRLICTAIWTLAIALSIPTVIYNERVEENNRLGKTIVVCQVQFESNKTARLIKVLVPSLQVTMGFFLPILVMVLCYASIIWTLLRAHSTQRHKAVRVVLAVVVVFILCHLPYNMTLLYHTVALFQQRECEGEKVILTALTATKSVAYLHCCLNPILYAFIGVKFRNHFRKILADLWCLGRKYIYPSGRSSRMTSDLYIPTRKSTDGSNNENGSSFTM
ncbi:C-C chemokine receptor type 6 [Salmo trutta]|uniref:Chemokine (C-C motif) receptor 6b n=1 Tax=Salmo trutta TaxID=8032 RepID=A0A673XLJ3_SALTR|nr:C-C chemokine receptor type 6-like [Salmo trutta]XP_029569701.1 C-C chemokine receptor type 6-like [Salmo trutta]